MTTTAAPAAKGAEETSEQHVEGPADAAEEPSPSRKRARVGEAEATTTSGSASSTTTGSTGMKVLRETLLDAEPVAALRGKVSRQCSSLMHGLNHVSTRRMHVQSTTPIPPVPGRPWVPALRRAGRAGAILLPGPARGDGGRAVGEFQGDGPLQALPDGGPGQPGRQRPGDCQSSSVCLRVLFFPLARLDGHRSTLFNFSHVADHAATAHPKPKPHTPPTYINTTTGRAPPAPPGAPGGHLLPALPALRGRDHGLLPPDGPDGLLLQPLRPGVPPPLPRRRDRDALQ